MAPTRSYRDGRRSDDATWAFPLVPYGDVASFEEAGDARIDDAAMGRWLVSLAGFAATDRSVRLFYFHPPGVIEYEGALDRMLDAVRARGNAFRWYTISGHAAFLDRRERTQWRISAVNGGWRLDASNPQGLAGLAWHVPAHAYGGVQPRSGDVLVAPVEDGWLLRVRDGTTASVLLPRRHAPR